MGDGTKMEVSNLQKLNNDGYLYAPEIIMDPKNLYFSPPKDENNNNKIGALVYDGDEAKLIEEDKDVPTSFSRYRYPAYHEIPVSYTHLTLPTNREV